MGAISFHICVYMFVCPTCFGDSIEERRYIKLYVASDLFGLYAKHEIDIKFDYPRYFALLHFIEYYQTIIHFCIPHYKTISYQRI